MKPNNDQYVWQQFNVSNSGVQSPPGLDAPAGYRMHSWQPCAFANNMITICWVRDGNIASTALAQLPPELTGPAVEWFRRWILRIM